MYGGWGSGVQGAMHERGCSTALEVSRLATFLSKLQTLNKAFPAAEGIAEGYAAVLVEARALVEGLTEAVATGCSNWQWRAAAEALKVLKEDARLLEAHLPGSLLQAAGARAAGEVLHAVHALERAVMDGAEIVAGDADAQALGEHLQRLEEAADIADLSSCLGTESGRAELLASLERARSAVVSSYSRGVERACGRLKRDWRAAAALAEDVAQLERLRGLGGSGMRALMADPHHKLREALREELEKQAEVACGLAGQILGTEAAQGISAVAEEEMAQQLLERVRLLQECSWVDEYLACRVAQRAVATVQADLRRRGTNLCEGLSGRDGVPAASSADGGSGSLPDREEAQENEEEEREWLEAAPQRLEALDRLSRLAGVAPELGAVMAASRSVAESRLRRLHCAAMALLAAAAAPGPALEEAEGPEPMVAVVKRPRLAPRAYAKLERFARALQVLRRASALRGACDGFARQAGVAMREHLEALARGVAEAGERPGQAAVEAAAGALRELQVAKGHSALEGLVGAAGGEGAAEIYEEAVRGARAAAVEKRAEVEGSLAGHCAEAVLRELPQLKAASRQLDEHVGGLYGELYVKAVGSLQGLKQMLVTEAQGLVERRKLDTDLRRRLDALARMQGREEVAAYTELVEQARAELGEQAANVHRLIASLDAQSSDGGDGKLEERAEECRRGLGMLSSAKKQLSEHLYPGHGEDADMPVRGGSLRELREKLNAQLAAQVEATQQLLREWQAKPQFAEFEAAARGYCQLVRALGPEGEAGAEFEPRLFRVRATALEEVLEVLAADMAAWLRAPPRLGRLLRSLMQARAADGGAYGPALDAALELVSRGLLHMEQEAQAKCARLELKEAAEDARIIRGAAERVAALELPLELRGRDAATLLQDLLDTIHRTNLDLDACLDESFGPAAGAYGPTSTPSTSGAPLGVSGDKLVSTLRRFRPDKRRYGELKERIRRQAATLEEELGAALEKGDHEGATRALAEAAQYTALAADEELLREDPELADLGHRHGEMARRVGVACATAAQALEEEVGRTSEPVPQEVARRLVQLAPLLQIVATEGCGGHPMEAGQGALALLGRYLGRLATKLTTAGENADWAVLVRGQGARRELAPLLEGCARLPRGFKAAELEDAVAALQGAQVVSPVVNYLRRLPALWDAGDYTQLVEAHCQLQGLKELEAVVAEADAQAVAEAVADVKRQLAAKRGSLAKKGEDAVRAGEFKVARRALKALSQTRELEAGLPGGEEGPCARLEGVVAEAVKRKGREGKRMMAEAAGQKGGVDLDGFAVVLIELKQLAEELGGIARSKALEWVRTLLAEYKSKYRLSGLSSLAALLQQPHEAPHHDRWGREIMAENDAFQALQHMDFNQRTGKFGVEYALEALVDSGSHDVRRAELAELFAQFQARHNQLLSRFLVPKFREQLGELVKLTKTVVPASSARGPPGAGWGEAARSLPELLAHIFVAWSLLQSGEAYFEAGMVKEALLTPHAVQVLAILRILGAESGGARPGGTSLSNHLAEVGTGEGKSVTLAVTAVALALLGFDVDCVCYSSHLSRRDHAAFAPLFRIFGLAGVEEREDRIRYGTFERFTELSMNARGDVRQQVLTALLDPAHAAAEGDDAELSTPHGKESRRGHGSSRSSSSGRESRSRERRHRHPRPRVLLVDEVDVFLQDTFCGGMYRVSTDVRSGAVSRLLRYMWAENKSGGHLRGLADVRATHVYQAALEELRPEYTFVLENAVTHMLAAMPTLAAHTYVVQGDRIGYRLHDGVSFEMRQGYHTLCAYLQEHDRGRITRASLDRQLGVLLRTGEFAYAEMPRGYQHILGATGTLRELSAEEGRILAAYGIEKRSYMPSIFGESNLEFSRGVDSVCVSSSRDEHLLRIQAEILQRRTGSGGKPRAVLAFFADRSRMEEFVESSYGRGLAEEVDLVVVSEETEEEDRLQAISRATTTGQVTLFTRVFGRGTDFVCRDEAVLQAGGPHVVQCFLAEEAREERQIRGRTARQGGKGSYSLIVCGDDLEELGVSMAVVDQWKQEGQLYQQLCAARDQAEQQRVKQRCASMDACEAGHRESQVFLEDLAAANEGRTDRAQAVAAFLRAHNPPPAGSRQRGQQSRTVCLLDATHSMAGLLDRSKTAVREMFSRALQVLHSERVDATFEMQFAAFRNYNAPPGKLLEASPWESSPEGLSSFIAKVDAGYGWGNEAIEIGLQHANREHRRQPITQVILIGDACPNTSDEVHWKREGSRTEWSGIEDYCVPTHWMEEASLLTAQGVPIHAFHVDEVAEEAFQAIAESTGGRNGPLSISSLTDVVTKQILENIGGEQLVQAYDATFTFAADG
ncbi:hypothetical protein CYMTET_48360 [Cymbomonas tetramitiformis]|uniref:chloroplast protein-transporting ATPase n=1 Tax=Cymbomonas tetramitiformis TaxID=36881 RepID=A0AAE0EVN9_9CHLO|nr:hypothetical protein CYMTET_48360 [Cymbomonas tetramitiformis]